MDSSGTEVWDRREPCNGGAVPAATHPALTSMIDLQTKVNVGSLSTVLSDSNIAAAMPGDADWGVEKAILKEKLNIALQKCNLSGLAILLALHLSEMSTSAICLNLPICVMHLGIKLYQVSPSLLVICPAQTIRRTDYVTESCYRLRDVRKEIAMEKWCYEGLRRY